MTAPLLAVEGLHVAFGAVEAVRGLSFTVAPGEVLAVVGESGSGKSATALAIMRLVEREGGTVAQGRILLDDGGPRDLAALSEVEMQAVRGRAISMVFQEPMTSLNPVLTVGDQLGEVFRTHQGLSGGALEAACREALARVRIGEASRRLSQYPHELSGGLRQRVMIAMALACRPRLLIADEPTTALDVTTQREILALIRALQAEIGMAVLFITHDMGVVAEMADRVVVLRHGKKMEDAPAGELFARPRHPYSQALLAAAPRLGEGAPAAAPPGEPVLELEGVSVRYPVRAGLLRRKVAEVHAVESVTLSVGRGETVGLVGESGCGKSTLARAALRLVPVRAGRIRLMGEDVTALSARALRPRRQAAQMIFQDPHAALNPRLPAWDIVSEPAAIHGLARGREARRALAAELLERVGLGAEHLERYAHQFSGGQRQRLCIARALSVRPRLIVADEPVAALDVSIARQITELLADLRARDGLSFLFISHDIAVVERISHRVAVMFAGEIVESGPTADVLGNPQHPYTRRLIAAVPRPDPALRGAAEPEPAGAGQLPSLVRLIGERRPASRLVERRPRHFVRVAEDATA